MTATLAVPSSSSTLETRAGNYTVSEGTLDVTAGNLMLSGNLVLEGGTVDIGGTIQVLAGVTIEAGTVTGSGILASQSAYELESGTVYAQLGGNVDVHKTGSGTMLLLGGAADPEPPISGGPYTEYFGIITISDGMLVIDGAQPLNDVVLEAGVLAGLGTIGNLTAIGGTVQPGDGGIGALTVNGAVTLSSATSLRFDVNGATTPGADYGQLIASGTIDLADAILVLNLGYTPTIGDILTVVRNDSGSAITGAFASIPAGWSVNYSGGDGNDVTLEYVG